MHGAQLERIVADTELSLFAACLPGLEPWLQREVEELGASDVRAVPGGVEFVGKRREMYRANLGSGIATQVLVRLDSFTCRHLAQLRNRAERAPWREVLAAGQPFALRAHCRQSKLYHSGAVAERVAAAIASSCGAEPVKDNSDVPTIAVRVHRDVVSLSFDTSGEPLHRRGWRLQTGKAPLREDLARALLLSADWDPATMLVDPMAGSGTIAIEAAGLARRLAPGRLRSFAFENTALFDAELWASVRDDAASRALDSAPARIFASDRDAGVVEAAAANAERAGVRADLELSCQPFSAAPVLSGETAADARGALVCNPPHGHRVGNQHKLRDLYDALGHRVRDLPAEWKVALLVADRRLALHSGLALSTGFLASHGGTKVRAMIGTAG